MLRIGDGGALECPPSDDSTAQRAGARGVCPDSERRLKGRWGVFSELRSQWRHLGGGQCISLKALKNLKES